MPYLVKASDGYQAAVSAAAVAMDPKGERYLLALRRDGQPLAKGQGPVRLIIPGDPQRVRWVRMVDSLRLVRLSTPKLAMVSKVAATDPNAGMPSRAATAASA